MWRSRAPAGRERARARGSRGDGAVGIEGGLVGVGPAARGWAERAEGGAGSGGKCRWRSVGSEGVGGIWWGGWDTGEPDWPVGFEGSTLALARHRGSRRECAVGSAEG